jgi:hypothetical protein
MATEGRPMKWLIALLAALGAAAAAGVVFRWRNPKAASSAWHHATDAATNAASAAASEAKSVMPH